MASQGYDESRYEDFYYDDQLDDELQAEFEENEEYYNQNGNIPDHSDHGF